MKTPNRLILISVILFSTLVLSAQNGRWGPLPANKFEEFKFSTQGHVKMVLDGFFNELSNNPADQGHIIIYPKTESQRRGIEKIITGQIKTRNFDRDRVTIVKGPVNADGIVQFWSVPPGTVAPKPVLGEETDEIIADKARLKGQSPLGPGRGTGTGSGDGTVRAQATAPVGPGVGMAPRSGTEPILQMEMSPELLNPKAPPSDVPFRILSKPRPAYTEAARANNIQGTVTLKITFLANGTIGTIVPVTRLPNGLTDQAIAAARLIRFEPVTKNGVPVTVTKIVAFSFTIY